MIEMNAPTVALLQRLRGQRSDGTHAAAHQREAADCIEALVIALANARIETAHHSRCTAGQQLRAEMAEARNRELEADLAHSPLSSAPSPRYNRAMARIAALEAALRRVRHAVDSINREFKDIILEMIDQDLPPETVAKQTQPCCFCGSMEHQEVCDSPGAIVTRTTGCPRLDRGAAK